MPDQVRVEVVFATAETQPLVFVTLPAGATVADAIALSLLAERFPAADFNELQAGIWGNLVDRGHILSDGDRVEIYRPLELDPREARRQLALLGQTMGGGSTD
jgi:putative ubiquitin-RnfH superfamily antitoxin RatB of RatAB toxin-antitoxin module